MFLFEFLIETAESSSLAQVPCRLCLQVLGGSLSGTRWRLAPYAFLLQRFRASSMSSLVPLFQAPAPCSVMVTTRSAKRALSAATQANEMQSHCRRRRPTQVVAVRLVRDQQARQHDLHLRRDLSASMEEASLLQADLERRIRIRADASYARWLSQYLRYATPVLGVRMGSIRAAVGEWADSNGLGELSKCDPRLFKEIALQMLRTRAEEHKLAGVLLLHERAQPAGVVDHRDLPMLAKQFDEGHVADWNVCDWLCVKVLARMVEQHGEAAIQGIAAWRDAKNVWRARAGVVGLLGVVKEERVTVLEGCRVLARREERFAKTAVGWALREIAKTSKEAIFAFLDEHAAMLSVESVRNATKACSKGERDKYLNMVRAARSP